MQAHRFTPKKGEGTNYLLPSKRNRKQAPAPQHLAQIGDPHANPGAPVATGDDELEEEESHLHPKLAASYDHLTEKEEDARCGVSGFGYLSELNIFGESVR